MNFSGYPLAISVFFKIVISESSVSDVQVLFCTPLGQNWRTLDIGVFD